MLVCHFMKLIHATFIEANVLLNVYFITVHDVSESVGNLVGKIFSFNLIFCWHQTDIELGILLTEKLTYVVNLFQVLLVWLLLLTNVTFHYIANIN